MWECLWPPNHQEAEKHQETGLRMETQYSVIEHKG